MKTKRICALALATIFIMALLPMAALGGTHSSSKVGLPVLTAEWTDNGSNAVLVAESDDNAFYNINVAGTVTEIKLTTETGNPLTGATRNGTPSDVTEVTFDPSTATATITLDSSKLADTGGGYQVSVTHVSGGSSVNTYVRFQRTGLVKATKTGEGTIYIHDYLDVISDWTAPRGTSPNAFDKIYAFNLGAGKYHEGGVRITPVPDAGYMVEKVTVNGKTISPSGSITDTGEPYYLVCDVVGGAGTQASPKRVASKLYNVHITFNTTNMGKVNDISGAVNAVTAPTTSGGSGTGLINQLESQLVAGDLTGNDIDTVLGALNLGVAAGPVSVDALANSPTISGKITKDEIIEAMNEALSKVAGVSGKAKQEIFDIDLKLDLSKLSGGGGGSGPTSIPDLGDHYIEVTFAIPDSLKPGPGETFAYSMIVFHEVSGVVQVYDVPLTYNASNGTVTARLSKFSYYMLMAVPVIIPVQSYTEYVLNNTPLLTPYNTAYPGYGDFVIGSTGFYNNFDPNESLYVNGEKLTAGVDYEVSNRNGYAQFTIYESLMQSLSGNVVFKATFKNGFSASTTVSVMNAVIPEEISIDAPKTGDNQGAYPLLMVLAALSGIGVSLRRRGLKG